MIDILEWIFANGWRFAGVAFLLWMACMTLIDCVKAFNGGCP